jgi:hypothetical protein
MHWELGEWVVVCVLGVGAVFFPKMYYFGYNMVSYLNSSLRVARKGSKSLWWVVVVRKPFFIVQLRT